VPYDDWHEIRRILTLYYADKRHLRTLKHQMDQITQGMKAVDAFYKAVNNPETTSVLVESYRDRALDVFIRGLNGDISKLSIIRGPKTLPEAYAICLELQNATFEVHVSEKNRFLSPHQAYRIHSDLDTRVDFNLTS